MPGGASKDAFWLLFSFLLGEIPKLPVKCIRVRLSTSQLPMKLELIDRPLELLSLVDAEYLITCR